MPDINDPIVLELQRLVYNATQKREMLRHNALTKSASKKRYTILSATLALLSAGAITSVIVKYFGNGTLQIIAAVSAAASGFISIVLAAYYGEEEITKPFEGSSKYLSLRDKTYRLLIHPNLANEQVFQELSELQNQYATLDEIYGKYARFKLRRKSERNQTSQLPPPVRARFSQIEQALDSEMEKFNLELFKVRDSKDNNS